MTVDESPAAALGLGADLIDDRAVDTTGDDRFAHRLFASELAALVRTVRTPANVALYGPWGSGKSGLGNLLERELVGVSGTRFARFDAFKYAEDPLRRHFISQVAHYLNIRSQKFTNELYTETTRNRLRADRADVGWLLLWIVVAWAVAQLLVAAGVLISEFASANGFVPRTLPPAIAAGIKNSLGTSVPIAGLVGLFLGVAGKSLTVTTRRNVPSGEEEFERLFRQLVEKANCDRLVILIDELDRCSSGEVVSTLEAVRTFLEVEGCVFVIAADQQVLEQALTKSARQRTPSDPTNPYYSAGSAYLDKIFQYQIAVPPLLSRRLSTFALDLIKAKGGVWNRLDREQIVSIVVPTHVSSPRRVKALLNSFVLLYQLAELREQAGLVTEVASHARELAKLTCLRVEFPLFARDLVLDSRLPELVLAAVGGERRPPGIGEDVWNRAQLYAAGNLPVDTLLTAAAESPRGVMTGDGSDPAPGGQGPAVHSGTEATEEEDEEEDSNGDGEDDLPGPSGDKGDGESTIAVAITNPDPDGVQRRYAIQLITYLQKTAHIGPIPRSIVYLEDSGNAYGLDPTTADSLRDGAVDRDISYLTETVLSLGSELQLAALKLLVREAHEAAVGIETGNVVSSLLALAKVVDESVKTQYADQICKVALAHYVRHVPPIDDLESAFEIALASPEPDSGRLAKIVMAQDAVSGLPNLCVRILEHAEVAGSGRVSYLLVGALAAPDTASSGVAALSRLSESDAVDAVRGIQAWMPRLAERLGPGDNRRSSPLGETVGAVLDVLTSTRVVLAQEFAAAVMTSVDDQWIRTAVGNRLTALGNARTPTFARALMHRVTQRNMEEWASWLERVDPALIAPADAATDVDRVAVALWEQRSKTPPPDRSVYVSTAAALGRIARQAPPDRPQLEALLAVALPESVAESDVATFSPVVGDAMRLGDAGVCPPELVADSLGTQLVSVMGQAMVAQPLTGQLVQYVAAYAPWAARNASSEVAAAVANGTATCAWLPSPVIEIVRLMTAAATSFKPRAVPSPFTAAEVLTLVGTYGERFDLGAEAWLESLAATPVDVASVVAAFAHGGLRPAIADGLRGYARRATPAQRLAVVEPFLSVDPTTRASDSFLAAAMFSESHTINAAHALESLIQRCTRMPEREVVLRYWSALKPNADARRRLIDQVMKRVVAAGASGLDLGLKWFDLMLPAPYGTKDDIRRMFREAARKHRSRRHQVEARLAAL